MAREEGPASELKSHGCWKAGSSSQAAGPRASVLCCLLARDPLAPCQGSLSQAVTCSVKATQEHDRSQDDDQNLLQLGPRSSVAAGPLHHVG